RAAARGHAIELAQQHDRADVVEQHAEKRFEGTRAGGEREHVTGDTATLGLVPHDRRGTLRERAGLHVDARLERNGRQQMARGGASVADRAGGTAWVAGGSPAGAGGAAASSQRQNSTSMSTRGCHWPSDCSAGIAPACALARTGSAGALRATPRRRSSHLRAK